MRMLISKQWKNCRDGDRAEPHEDVATAFSGQKTSGTAACAVSRVWRR